jgi:hypothetical protein
VTSRAVREEDDEDGGHHDNGFNPFFNVSLPNQGPILWNWNSISAENFSDKFSFSHFGFPPKQTHLLLGLLVLWTIVLDFKAF